MPSGGSCSAPSSALGIDIEGRSLFTLRKFWQRDQDRTPQGVHTGELPMNQSKESSDAGENHSRESALRNSIARGTFEGAAREVVRAILNHLFGE